MGETFRYPGTCRDANVPACEPHALRLRVPAEGQTVVEDLLHGSVVFDHASSTTGSSYARTARPTYNFCVVVDDVTMKITHVIRGDDHLSNTPKQVQCYQALGYPTAGVRAHPVDPRPPTRIGCPSATGRPVGAGLPRRGHPGRGPLQLPRPARLVARRPGDLLARRRWPSTSTSPMSASAAAVFDRTKLEWLSQHWIKTLPAAAPRRAAAALPRAGGAAGAGGPGLARAGGGRRCKERAKTLVEMAAGRDLLLPGARGVRQGGHREVLDAGGPGALRADHQAAERPRGHGPGHPRGALPGARRGARAQAGRPRPAHAPGPHRHDGEPAYLRGRRRSSASEETLARLRAAQAAAEGKR